MFKNFLVRKMLRAQGASEEQADVIVGLMEKNPALFKQIASEIEEKIKSGQDKQAAAIEVMAAYEAELKKMMG